jgi:hypothetical protein
MTVVRRQVASNRECCAVELKSAEMSSDTACPMLLDAAPAIVEVPRVASIALGPIAL